MIESKHMPISVKYLKRTEGWDQIGNKKYLCFMFTIVITDCLEAEVLPRGAVQPVKVHLLKLEKVPDIKY